MSEKENLVPPPYNGYKSSSSAEDDCVVTQLGSCSLQPHSVQVTLKPRPPLTNPPPDYLYFAVAVTLCCFWPTGLVAIFRSMDVRKSATRGDSYSAVEASHSAKQLSWISLGIGVSIIFTATLLYVLSKRA
ncbi:proline-rich transmembrane protein 1-like [Saccoglossus kowalevskii]|uniref:Proline-rich transmembrane protein 1-like n=1 Tax=Saccoglossus kowalevskii TaxID=10224 RepID=A0ABM0LWX4_SACKO|nr:PREDICTED: proline-rich transmembrane protein 1-like [Saccoglossus kowalevskii]